MVEYTRELIPSDFKFTGQQFHHCYSVLMASKAHNLTVARQLATLYHPSIPDNHPLPSVFPAASLGASNIVHHGSDVHKPRR